MYTCKGFLTDWISTYAICYLAGSKIWKDFVVKSSMTVLVYAIFWRKKPLLALWSKHVTLSEKNCFGKGLFSIFHFLLLKTYRQALISFPKSSSQTLFSTYAKNFLSAKQSSLVQLFIFEIVCMLNDKYRHWMKAW